MLCVTCLFTRSNPSLHRNLVALSRQLAQQRATDDGGFLTGRHCLILCVLLLSQLLLNYVFSWAPLLKGDGIPSSTDLASDPSKKHRLLSADKDSDLRSVFGEQLCPFAFPPGGMGVDIIAINTATATTCQSSAERNSTPLCSQTQTASAPTHFG